MWNTVSRPHAGEAQINTDFVRLLRNKNTPSFVLSDLAHVEAFPLFLMGESARMHSGISLMEREPGFLLQCSTLQEKMALSAKGGETMLGQVQGIHLWARNSMHVIYTLP